MSVHIGFFRDFKSSDTLLIDGDSDGLRQLADELRGLARNGVTIEIHKLAFVQIHHGIRITATRAEWGTGASIDDRDISWTQSESGWRSTAEKLETLTTGAPGHQYLDADGDQITVEASRGEYDDAWWTQNG